MASVLDDRARRVLNGIDVCFNAYKAPEIRLDAAAQVFINLVLHITTGHHPFVGKQFTTGELFNWCVDRAKQFAVSMGGSGN